MASSSSNNNRPLSSSTPNVHHRSLENVRQLDLVYTNPMSNTMVTNEQRIRRQAIQLANELQHLHVNQENNQENLPSPISTITTNNNNNNHLTQVGFYRENGSLSENELIERLKQLIDIFMTTRPDQHYQYNTTIRWTVDHANEINYSVVVVIHQPAHLI